MHICVIGAGVVGLTTAYFLQSEGHSVTIFERESAAGQGASAANGAQLSYAFVAPLADASLPQRLPALFLARNSPLKLHFRLDVEQWRWAIAFLRHANTGAARATTASLLRLAQLSREFIEPLIFPAWAWDSDDGAVFLNFREDRMRQLVQAVCIDNFSGFTRLIPAL